MNASKTKQLKKMAEIYLRENGTKYLSKKQYEAKPFHTTADDRLYAVYRNTVKSAKRNYSQMEEFIKEKLGEEWKTRIFEEW